MGHGVGRLKSSAYALVPEVIKKGLVFADEKNWKNRGYNTFVLIAPVEINNQPHVCEVVVEQRQNRQGFYLHEVDTVKNLEDVFKTPTKGSTPSRSYLIISKYWQMYKDIINKLDENGEPKAEYLKNNKTGTGVRTVGTKPTPTTNAFTSSIKQKGKFSSKQKYSLGTDGQRLTNPESDNLEDLYNNLMNGSEEEFHDNEDRRYALGGERAKTANIARLNEAKRMLADGEDKKRLMIANLILTKM